MRRCRTAIALAVSGWIASVTAVRYLDSPSADQPCVCFDIRNNEIFGGGRVEDCLYPYGRITYYAPVSEGGLGGTDTFLCGNEPYPAYSHLCSQTCTRFGGDRVLADKARNFSDPIAFPALWNKAFPDSPASNFQPKQVVEEKATPVERSATPSIAATSSAAPEAGPSFRQAFAAAPSAASQTSPSHAEPEETAQSPKPPLSVTHPEPSSEKLVAEGPGSSESRSTTSDSKSFPTSSPTDTTPSTPARASPTSTILQNTPSSFASSTKMASSTRRPAEPSIAQIDTASVSTSSTASSNSSTSLSPIESSMSTSTDSGLAGGSQAVGNTTIPAENADATATASASYSLVSGAVSYVAAETFPASTSASSRANPQLVWVLSLLMLSVLRGYLPQACVG